MYASIHGVEWVVIPFSYEFQVAVADTVQVGDRGIGSSQDFIQYLAHGARDIERLRCGTAACIMVERDIQNFPSSLHLKTKR